MRHAQHKPNSPIDMAWVYFVLGDVPTYLLQERYHVKDPPVSGWGLMVVMPGEKRTTLLDPHSLESVQVPNDCGELRNLRPMDHDMVPESAAATITRNWEQWARLGQRRDYDVAAVALTMLGAPVPTVSVAAPVDPLTGEAKVRGGKVAVSEALRPMRRASKRGQVAEFFLKDEPQSIREAMAKFGMTRSGVLSHLFTVNKEHGLAYRLANDCAVIDCPEGFEPFEVPVAHGEPNVQPEAVVTADGGGVGAAAPEPRRGGGKPTDPSRLSLIKRASKRGAIVERFLQRGSVDAASKELSLTRSAVLSHLFTIWKEHGIGYSLDGEGFARLLVPEGFAIWQSSDAPKQAAVTQNASDDEWLR